MVLSGAAAVAIVFDRSFTAPYGEPIRLTAHITRVLAPNPGPFTFKGTGTYIVGSGRAAAVIDPGPDLPEHIAALQRALAGRALTHILITHTHADHSPAAAPLKAWSGARTYGFGPHGGGHAGGLTLEAGSDRHFVPDAVLGDGDVVAGEGFTLDVLHTPGHTANHLCFALREERALFTGDQVMGWSTTVINPPDGDMAAYMASLRRLLARDDAVLWPTHGGPVQAPKPFLAAYLEHRLAREAQILAALAKGIATIPAMVAELYADMDPRLHPAAARSVAAHLIQLTNAGQVEAVGDTYRLR